MKIWMLAENWPPRRGGIENYLTHIAEQLTRTGHEVVVVAPKARIGNPNFAGLRRAQQESGIEERTTHVQVVRRRFFWPLIKPAWLPLFIALWRWAKYERPDIIICGKALFEGLLGYYLKRHLTIPYVICTYGMEVAAWQRRRGTARALQRVLGAADLVTHLSDGMMAGLQELGVTPERLLKVHPGVNERFLRSVNDELVEATLRHYSITKPYVLSVGRLIPRKGFDTLIEAFAQLDQTKFADLSLVIVGSGADQARLEKLAEENWMSRSIRFLSNVPDKHLPALYKGAQVFALTPREIDGDVEGFGIVYLEAAAMGTPVVGTTTGGVAEAVGDDETGRLVSPGDSTALARVLTELLSDATLRQDLGKRAQRRAQEQFRWPKQVVALRATLERIAQERTV